MLSFDALRLEPSLKKSLTGALAVRFPQTVLITGTAGSGKHALGLTLAAALLCAHGRPCGTCNSCKKAEHGAHPDLIVVEDEIKVDDARRIRAEASVLPNDGDRKVFLITEADRMNPAAQNALLKVLEEPPRYCFFILLAQREEAILETIRSRCTRYHLPPAEETIDEALLPKLAPYLEALASGSEAGLMQAAVGIEKLTRPQVRAWLSLLQTALRDAIFAAEDLGAPLLPQLAQETGALAARVTPRRLQDFYEFAAVLTGRAELNAAAAAMTCALTADAYRICLSSSPAEGRSNLRK